MIYYITNNEADNIFHFLEEEGEFITLSAKINLKLDVFCKTEMRNIQAVEILAINILALDLADINELKSNIESFYLMYPKLHVILVANSGVEPDLLGQIKENATEKDNRRRYYLIADHNIEDQVKRIMEQIKNGEQEEPQLDKGAENIQEDQPQEKKKSIEKKQKKVEQKLIDFKTPRRKKINEDPSILTMLKEPEGGNEVEKLKEEIVTESKEESKEELGVEAVQEEGLSEELEEMIKEPLPESIKINLFEHFRKDKKKIKWNCENILIGIVGSQERIGVTTVAFHLVEYLDTLSATVSYSEANGKGDLEKWAAQVPGFFEKGSGEYNKEGVTYFSNSQIRQGNNFAVIDIGTANESNLELIHHMNFIILCGGYKPAEVEHTNAAIKRLANSKLIIILPFETIDEVQGSNRYNYEYSPDPLNRNKKNDHIFFEAVKEYVVNENHIQVY